MLLALSILPFQLFAPFGQYRHGCDPPELPTLLFPHPSAFLASYLLLPAIQKISNSPFFPIGLRTLNLLDIPSDTPRYSEALLSLQK